MSFALSEVHQDNEFAEILEIHRAAFQTVDNRALWRLLYPEFDHNANPVAASLADGVARTIGLHRADPNSHWIKAIDMETGRVVGAARWIIATANPFRGPPEIDSFWWPAGEQREFANICMKQFRSPRYQTMQRPHVFLNVCFTHPAYRRRGVGSMLMDWGLQRADALGLPCYVDATAEGSVLYANYGFVVVSLHAFRAEKANPSPVWREMHELIIPYTWLGMLRPRLGERAHATASP